MIRWTPEKVDELRSLAHLGGAEVARRWGVTPSSVFGLARRESIHMGARVAPGPGLRARWAEMLPGMKAAIREAVLASAN